MAMSYSRWQEMLRSVPANARKLYDIIPIAEGWSYSQIHQEAQRRGLNMSVQVIMGCVGELKDAGLVQTIDNMHRRTPHKDKPELISVASKEHLHVEPIKTRPAAAAAEPPKSATDRLADLAGRIEKMSNVANMLVTEAKAISEDLADVAVAIEESEGATSKELETLRALKALLRG